MRLITQLSGRKISTDTFDIRCVQGLCFAAGVGIFGLSSWKLMTLDLSIAQTLCGLLLSATVALLCIVLGLLLPLAHVSLRTDSRRLL